MIFSASLAAASVFFLPSDSMSCLKSFSLHDTSLHNQRERANAGRARRPRAHLAVHAAVLKPDEKPLEFLPKLVLGRDASCANRA